MNTNKRVFTFIVRSICHLFIGRHTTLSYTRRLTTACAREELSGIDPHMFSFSVLTIYEFSKSPTNCLLQSGFCVLQAAGSQHYLHAIKNCYETRRK